MDKATLLAMLQRKSVTVLGGACLGVWAVLTYPELFTGKNLLAFAAGALLLASGKMSADNESKKAPKDAEETKP